MLKGVKTNEKNGNKNQGREGSRETGGKSLLLWRPIIKSLAGGFVSNPPAFFYKKESTWCI